MTAGCKNNPLQALSEIGYVILVVLLFYSSGRTATTQNTQVLNAPGTLSNMFYLKFIYGVIKVEFWVEQIKEDDPVGQNLLSHLEAAPLDKNTGDVWNHYQPISRACQVVITW